MSNKTKLLELMEVDDHANVDDHVKAIEAVIQSGLLPQERLKLWLNGLVEKVIRQMSGKSGIPKWEVWAKSWLSGADRSALSADDARLLAVRASFSTASPGAATATWVAQAAAQAAWAIARADAARVAAWTGVAYPAAEDVAWEGVAYSAAWAAARATGADDVRTDEARKAHYDYLLNIIQEMQS